MEEKTPSLSDIKRAFVRIQPHLFNTPVLTSHSIDKLTEAEIYFKCENFQKVGSVKTRGALNAVLSYTPEERKNGFATHSSGNHAQAVATAARLVGTKAYIVLPENSAEVKKNAVEGYGAEVIYCKPGEKARQEACDKIIKETGAIFIPPYDDYRIIAGQATATKELIEETPDLDYIIIPVGGGDLSAGSALAVKYLCPNTKVILAEPANADDAYRSFKAKKHIPLDKEANTIADSLKISLGVRNFDIIINNVHDIMTVKEATIVSSMRMIWERMKIIIEPSCAVPLAAIFENKGYFKGKKIGVVLTAGNVDLESLPF